MIMGLFCAQCSGILLQVHPGCSLCFRNIGGSSQEENKLDLLCIEDVKTYQLNTF